MQQGLLILGWEVLKSRDCMSIELCETHGQEYVHPFAISEISNPKFKHFVVGLGGKS